MNKANGLRRTERKAPCVRDKSISKKVKSPSFGWESSNWSGYVLSRRKGSINRIAGEWIVPKVSAKKKPGYSSIWIGIDGFNNSSLIQAGTEQDLENGPADYYAWWEILPAAETKIPYPVSPGDRMRAEIQQVGKGNWSIRLINFTKKWLFRIVRPYSGPMSSAEWIVEAPQVNGRITKLANYGRTSLNRCRVNGLNPKLVKANGGFMTQGGVQVSTPSAPNRHGDGFTVFYGITRSSAPGSTYRKSFFAMKRSKPLVLIGKV